MIEETTQDITLASKAEAAFRQAAKKVIQLARLTDTPVVVWQEDHVVEIPVDKIEIIADTKRIEAQT